MRWLLPTWAGAQCAVREYLVSYQGLLVRSLWETLFEQLTILTSPFQGLRDVITPGDSRNRGVTYADEARGPCRVAFRVCEFGDASCDGGWFGDGPESEDPSSHLLRDGGPHQVCESVPLHR